MIKPKGPSGLFISFLLLVIWNFLTPAAEGAAYKDISNHWAKGDIEFVAGKGIIAGYNDGSFQPDRNVTRAEYIAMINRTLRLTTVETTNFTDVKANDWYAADIGKAKAAGYVSGYSDGSIRPGQSITRQEAAFMIAKALGLYGGKQQVLSKYTDNKKISSWCSDRVSAVVTQGYMGGYYDNTFKPDKSITRAEAAVILRAVYGSRPTVSTPTEPVSMDEPAPPVEPAKVVSKGGNLDKAGTFGPESGTETISGNVNINVTGITLRNSLITGNLVIARSVGDGSVTLSNVTVQGTVNVQGGGRNSVTLDNCTVPKLIVYRDEVRILATGTTSISYTTLNSGAILEESKLTGNGFVTVDITSSTKTHDAIQLTGSFGCIQVSSAVDISIPQGSQIATMCLDSPATVTGSGTINTAWVNVAGVHIQQNPGKTIVEENIYADVGGKYVYANKAPTFYSGYPQVSHVTSTSFDLFIKIDKTGFAYYMVLDDGNGAPSSEQVKKFGTASSSSSQGVVSLKADTESSIKVSHLLPGIAYDVYVVAEDNDGKLRGPARLDVTTTQDSGGVLNFSSSKELVAENVSAGNIVLIVNRNGGSTTAVTVNFSTVDISAHAGVDYVSTNGTLTWAAGETGSKSITVPIINDNLPENPELFGAVLSNASGAVLGSPSYVTIMINSEDAGYNLSVQTNLPGGGTVTGGGFFTAGETAAVTATPPVGYSFVNWTSGSAIVSNNASFNYTMPGLDTTLVANFAKNYTVNLLSDPDSAGVLKGAGNYLEGQSATVSAIANSGYQFDHWALPDGTTVSGSSTFTFAATDFTLVAHFSPVP